MGGGLPAGPYIVGSCVSFAGVEGRNQAQSASFVEFIGFVGFVEFIEFIETGHTIETGRD
jgi:hypothetical protein